MIKTIIFIGGWTRDKKSYKVLFDSVPSEYEVIFLPCYEILDVSSMDESADKVLNFFKKNHIDGAILAGHSLGGTVATEFALKYPMFVKKLILIDSGGLRVNQSFLEKTKNASRDQIINFSKKVKSNLNFGLRVARRPLKSVQSLRVAYLHDLSNRLGRLSADTLILWGENDHVYPVEQGQIFNKLIESSRLIVLPRMDHDWIIHAPELFWKELEVGDV